MFKKTSFHFFMLALGVGLVALAFTLSGQEVKAVSGVMLGIGAGSIKKKCRKGVLMWNF